MGRYPLFLKSSIEKLPEKHPDRITVPQALATIRDILTKINLEAGKAENALKLSRLQAQIFFNPGEEMVRGIYSDLFCRISVSRLRTVNYVEKERCFSSDPGSTWNSPFSSLTIILFLPKGKTTVHIKYTKGYGH